MYRQRPFALARDGVGNHNTNEPSMSHSTNINPASYRQLAGIPNVELLPVWWTRCLARGGDPLEFHRAVVADGRVAPLRIVEAFYVIEHFGAGLVAAALSQTLPARLMLHATPFSAMSF